MTTASDSTYVETAVRCRKVDDFISASDIEVTIFPSRHLALVSSVPFRRCARLSNGPNNGQGSIGLSRKIPLIKGDRGDGWRGPCLMTLLESERVFEFLSEVIHGKYKANHSI